MVESGIIVVLMVEVVILVVKAIVLMFLVVILDVEAGVVVVLKVEPVELGLSAETHVLMFEAAVPYTSIYSVYNYRRTFPTFLVSCPSGVRLRPQYREHGVHQ